MASLQINKAKPNPAGKDKNRFGHATPAQLGGEWVDIRNSGSNPVTLDGLELWHLEYPTTGEPKLALVCTLYATLGAFETLRVHSGVKVSLAELYSQDVNGAEWHQFTSENRYVWNNDRRDTPVVWNRAKNADVDRTYYDADPPEGVMLVRSGEKLIPPVGAPSGLYR
jgi:hypothetical protein